MNISCKTWLLTGACSLGFAFSMPAPYYTYNWGMTRSGSSGWNYSQTVTNGTQGGWVGYGRPGAVNGIDSNLNSSNTPGVISGSGAPPPPDPTPIPTAKAG